MACIDDFYTRMFRNWPGAVTRRDDGYTLSYSGNVYLSGANHIWPHHLHTFNPQAIYEAAAFFAAFEAAWSVICVRPYMDAIIDRLYEQAFTLRWDSALMVLDNTAWADAPRLSHPSASPPPVRMIQAMSKHHLHDLTCVLSEAFSTGPSVNRRVARIDHLNDPTVRHYLLYQGLHPVSAATVTLHPQAAQMASIWNVGTRPRFQRKGYARLLMSGVLADLRAQGITTSMLLASPSGYGLYERLGYREIGTVVYLGPPHELH